MAKKSKMACDDKKVPMAKKNAAKKTAAKKNAKKSK